ncbi:MAG: sulfatase family protein [Solirubrobacteraceae bacterium]
MTTWYSRTTTRGPSTRAAVVALLLTAAAVGIAFGLVASGNGQQTHASVAPAPGGGGGLAPPADVGAGPAHPNIVFVLTDDLSMDLLPYMPQVRALQRQGLTFNNYFVSVSLCCPSRASIFTGEFPHDTRVFSNAGPNGGIAAFFAHGDENRTFNLALEQAGYRTAMMGKYLNGYLDGPTRSPLGASEVPAGWTQWDVAGWGYPEFDYPMDINGRVRRFGHRPRAYLTNVLARRGVQFIDRAAHSGRPFFLELATFAPHFPYTPAPRYAHAFPGLTAPEPPSFDTLPINPPQWLASHPPLGPRQLARIDWAFRRRVQAVQSIDDLIAKVRAALARHGLSGDTYVVFSSDNGLHTGEYRLMPGKLTAFDTDIRVPLVVAGPGVRAGTTTDAMTENVDLAETFAALGGTSLAGDGQSLVPLLHGQDASGWRTAILVEHHGRSLTGEGPDQQAPLSGNPPTYEAMRTRRFLYVEYTDGEREFYDLRTDPYEIDNLAGSLSPGQIDQLHAELTRLQDCHGSAACWAAGHVGVSP